MKHWLSLTLFLLVPATATATETSPFADPAWLPEGWVVRETTALGSSGVGSIPSLQGQAEGRVLLAAETKTRGGALFLVEIDAPLTIDVHAKEALLLSAPEALRHLWGVDVEVRWVDVVQLEGEPTLQLQGRIRRDSGIRHLRLAALAQGPRHLLLVLTWPETDTGELAVEAERVLLALPRPIEPAVSFWSTSPVSSTVAGLLGAGFLGLLLLAYRRFATLLR